MPGTVLRAHMQTAHVTLTEQREISPIIVFISQMRKMRLRDRTSCRANIKQGKDGVGS